LAKSGADAAISEKALYNLGCDAVYLGDYLKKASEDPANQNFADSLKNMSTESYKQAIEDYKALLRKKPNNLRAVQNLRIAQLKLPPEEQGGGGGNNNDQNKDQNQQQQQQQDQQQQQQQQQQPQPQQQQNQNDKQILQSVQAKENKTRKKQPGDPAYGKVTDKPW
jgi:transcription initiation factor TFIID subunit TAF12